MASSTSFQPCLKCPKGRGQVICSGCQQSFCLRHLNEHRQELNQQMDGVLLEHDQLQQDLTLNDNGRQHPLLSDIDQWESKSIEIIKQVANKARQKLRESLYLPKRKIETLLRPISDELQENRRMESYTEADLTAWKSRLQELREKFNNPPGIVIKQHDEVSSTEYLPLIQLRIVQENRVPEHISNETKWSMNGLTVAGGHGQGDGLDQLNHPYGLDVDDDGTMFIADMNNHGIIRWRPNAVQGEIIAGVKGVGSQDDQLNLPMGVLIDRKNDSLIISEEGNRRIMRWSLDEYKENYTKGEILISGIYCVGLSVGTEGVLYVSDFERHQVRRYGPVDGREGVIVAGGNGQGAGLNQLNGPRNIYVDADQSIYVSDRDNDRVMKWMKNAREGVVVAGGEGQGNSLKQLYCPSGIFVDRVGSVYVVDQMNHRVMRWLKDANQGEVIIGGNGTGTQNNQLCQPTSISFDNRGNLYVVDRNNHRIQHFAIE